MWEVRNYSFSCPICGKEFEIMGRWYNQWIPHQTLDYKYLIHQIVKHGKRPYKKLAKQTLLWIPLIFFQILDIPLQILRRIL